LITVWSIPDYSMELQMANVSIL